MIYIVVNSFFGWAIRNETIILFVTLCLHGLGLYALLKYLYLFYEIKTNLYLLFLALASVGIFIILVFRMIIKRIPKEWYFK